MHHTDGFDIEEKGSFYAALIAVKELVDEGIVNEVRRAYVWI